jgi:hypothetical protein
MNKRGTVMGKLADQTDPKQEKYSTLAELRRGVRRVRGVTPGERNYLNVMAHYCDWRTGLCRPGNERLQDESGLSESGTRYVRAQLEAKGLIELWQPGQKNVGGRNHANVFRLCTEGDAFPPEDKPRSNKDRVSASNKPRSNKDRVSNPAAETANPAVKSAKPRSRPPETPYSDWPPSTTTSNTTSKERELPLERKERSDGLAFSLQSTTQEKPAAPAALARSQPKGAMVVQRDASAKVLTALTHAGQTGQSSAELAQSLYGETNYAAKSRVNQVVGTLRRKGYTIIVTGTDPLARRYVLRQN